MTIKTKGLKQLLRAHKKMPALVEKNMELGLKKATRLVREYAKDNHKFTSRTHRLEKSIDSIVRGSGYGAVYLNDNVANYGPMVHEGTRPHVITGDPLRFPTSGGFVFAKTVNHPGTKPDQFIYDAAKKKEKETDKIFEKVIDDSIKGAGL